MDILDLTVGAHESNILNEDLRECFPRSGMKCQVAVCQDSRHFSSLTSYRRHWRRRHVEYLPFWMCPMEECDFRDLEKSDIIGHLVSKHKLKKPAAKEKTVSLKKETALNKYFVPPGDVLPPKKALDYSQMFEETVISAPRDMNLNFLEDGTVTMTEKGHWKSKN